MTGGGGGGGGSGGASPSSPTADRSNPHHHQQQQQMGNNDDSIREVHSRFELYASQLAQVRVGVVLRMNVSNPKNVTLRNIASGCYYW